MIHLQLRNDAIFQQHVQVSGELRRHLEENAAGEVFVSVAANDVDPLQSSPLADSPVASSYVASRSLEASGTYMAPLRFTTTCLLCTSISNVLSVSPGTTPANPVSAMHIVGSRFAQLAGTAEAGKHAT